MDGVNTKLELKQELAGEIRSKFKEISGETTERNQKIEQLDQYLYEKKLEKMLDIPIGHDFTPVNWLSRTVEIHTNIFMSRGFQVVSTYDTQNIEEAGDEEEKERIRIENQRRKGYAEARKAIIDGIIRDNDSNALWISLAKNASSIGTAALKAYYDEDEERYVLSEIEAIENLYVLWSRDDFRRADAFAFAYQVSKQDAIRDYGAPENVATSPLGNPLEVIGNATNAATTGYTQQMVTILEVTGRIEGWASEKGKLKRVPVGDETLMNVKIIGDDITSIIDEEKRIPRYYILPNKRVRRRAWGQSDITDAAIDLNLTYIETLSDWRTHASKVNFQKYKAFNFGGDTQLPKHEPRKVQIIPLGEGQDMQRLDQGDSNAQDFKAQMDELKEQYVRETGISRVLLDDPSVALNSNQALLTSMKPTSDIAEAKKQLWGPIIQQIFEDALEIVGMWKPEVREVADPNDNWHLKIIWPSLMNREDPIYQQMLLNRFNTNTISLQTYLEEQGESKEEIDRLRDEMQDPLLAAIHGRVVGQLAANIITPPQEDKPQVKTNINLRGDLTPYQEANLAHQYGFNDGPFPPTAGPQGTQGLYAQENLDNKEFLTAHPSKGGEPIFRGPDGQPVEQGQQAPQQDAGGQQINTQANNQEGTGAVSLPGSGQATPTSAQGAINQTNQNTGG